MTGPLYVRIRTVVLAASAAVLVALPAVPVSAQTSDSSANLNCTITLTTDIIPGLTTQASHQAVTTHGLTGTAVCIGTVNGQPVTGPGRYGNTQQGVSSCLLGNFTGTFVLKIPTLAGEQTIMVCPPCRTR